MLNLNFGVLEVADLLPIEKSIPKERDQDRDNSEYHYSHSSNNRFSADIPEELITNDIRPTETPVSDAG